MTRNPSLARIALPVALALVLVLVPAALAGKGGRPGGGKGGNLALAMVTDQNGNGTPNHSDQVTFSVTTTADKPYVNVRCYQSSAFVFDSWAGFYAGAWFGQTFTLASSYWTAGAADCTARLVAFSKNGREQTLATLSFHVDA